MTVPGTRLTASKALSLAAKEECGPPAPLMMAGGMMVEMAVFFLCVFFSLLKKK